MMKWLFTLTLLICAASAYGQQCANGQCQVGRPVSAMSFRLDGKCEAGTCVPTKPVVQASFGEGEGVFATKPVRKVLAVVWQKVRVLVHIRGRFGCDN